MFLHNGAQHAQRRMVFVSQSETVQQSPLRRGIEMRYKDVLSLRKVVLNLGMVTSMGFPGGHKVLYVPLYLMRIDLAQI